MSIADKVALANKIKTAVIGSKTPLFDELDHWARPEWAKDEDFLSLLHERAIACDACAVWCNPEDIDDDGLCSDCNYYDWDDEE